MALRITFATRSLQSLRTAAQHSTSRASALLPVHSTRHTGCSAATDASPYQTYARGFTQGTRSRESFAKEDRLRWSILRTRPPPGHKYWGFTIYRCTYGDDAAWSQLMQFMHELTKKGVESWNAPELMKSLNMRVHEDPAQFESASKDKIREHFKSWTHSATDESVDHPNAVPRFVRGHAATARYQFCLQLDAEALYSIIDPVSKALKSRAKLNGHINLIDVKWALADEDDCAVRREIDGMEDPLDEREEPLEGCRLFDVGWMKMRPMELLPHFYPNIESTWEYSYRRPPALVPWLGE